MSDKIAGWIALYILPSYWTLGFNSFCKWYDTNGYYRFRIGDVISSSPHYFGYGLNPLNWKVLGYTDEGKYIIDADGEEQIQTVFNHGTNPKRA